MTPEQAALLEKARRSIRSAQAQIELGDYDFAASRAYYAMFYAAEAMLLGKELSFSKHSAVIAAFGLHFVRAGIVPSEFQRYLTEGDSLRNVSDYDVGPPVKREDAEQQAARAREFVTEVARLLQGRGEMPLGK